MTSVSMKIEFPQITPAEYQDIKTKGSEFIKSFPPDTIVGLQVREGGSPLRPFVAFSAGQQGARDFGDWCRTHRDWFACDIGFLLTPIGNGEKAAYVMPYN